MLQSLGMAAITMADFISCLSTSTVSIVTWIQHKGKILNFKVINFIYLGRDIQKYKVFWGNLKYGKLNSFLFLLDISFSTVLGFNCCIFWFIMRHIFSMGDKPVESLICFTMKPCWCKCGLTVSCWNKLEHPWEILCVVRSISCSKTCTYPLALMVPS